MKNKKLPLVSIIIPVHNGQKFLTEMLLSIKNQTYNHYELILINDGSTDKSFEILCDFKKNINKRVIVINNKKGLGFSGDAAFNQGMRLAKGKYIAKTDQDDIWHKEKLSKQVTFLESNKDVFLCGTWFEHVTNKGEKYYPVKLPANYEDIQKTMFYKANIHTPTILFRNTGKEFFELRYPKYNDTLTFLKLLAEGKFFSNIPEVLFYYRIHDNNYNHSNLKKLFIYYMLAKYEAVKKYGYRPRVIDVLLSVIQFVFVVMIPEFFIKKIHPAFKNL